MYLSDVCFPASREALLAHVQEYHATRILPLLACLPERDYGSALEVVKAVIEMEAGAKRPPAF